MKYKLIAIGLILLGSIQMIGDLCHMPVLKGIGQATNSSPAPKIFTSQQGYETFSKRFFFKVVDQQGNTKIIEIKPNNYQNLKGPYNRRNMYGAAISYAPVLVKFPHTKPMFDSVAEYGLYNQKQSILDEMEIQYDKTKPIVLLIEPRHQGNHDGWTNQFNFNHKESHHA